MRKETNTGRPLKGENERSRMMSFRVDNDTYDALQIMAGVRKDLDMANSTATDVLIAAVKMYAKSEEAKELYQRREEKVQDFIKKKLAE